MDGEMLAEAVENIQEDKALFIAKQMLEYGYDKEDIISYVQLGLDRVGELFEKGEYYIADLMMAGILFKEILALNGMQESIKTDVNNIGTVMVTTVEGDLHDIGKNIFSNMVKAAGYKLIDLGTDVKLDDIVKGVAEYHPDVLGLSAILTHTTKTIRKTITALCDNGLRDNMKIIVGGSAFKDFIPTDIKADSIVADANEGMKIIKEWLDEKESARK